jgi:hypothetical protein
MNETPIWVAMFFILTLIVITASALGTVAGEAMAVLVLVGLFFSYDY